MRPTPALMLALGLSLSGAAVVASSPAVAQDAGEKVNQLIVYGDDPCPPSTGDQITVCARKGEAERFRIPEILRGNPQSARNEPWTERVLAYETVGDQGIASCSPVGPGGATGCLAQLIDAAYARRGGADARFGQLIAEERERRLSTIDEEAAATQARVEQLEREYEARLRAQDAAEAEAAGVRPAPVDPAPVPGPGVF